MDPGLYLLLLVVASKFGTSSWYSLFQAMLPPPPHWIHTIEQKETPSCYLLLSSWWCPSFKRAWDGIRRSGATVSFWSSGRQIKVWPGFIYLQFIVMSENIVGCPVPESESESVLQVASKDPIKHIEVCKTNKNSTLGVFPLHTAAFPTPPHAPNYSPHYLEGS